MYSSCHIVDPQLILAIISFIIIVAYPLKLHFNWFLILVLFTYLISAFLAEISARNYNWAI